MNSKTPLPIRFAVAIGGAAIAVWLGSYAVISWYSASREERENLVREWLDVFLNGGE